MRVFVSYAASGWPLLLRDVDRVRDELADLIEAQSGTKAKVAILNIIPLGDPC